jgi:hypothetical protein
MRLADHLRGSVLGTAFPIRPSLLRFGAEAYNCGPAQDGVKTRCSVGHTKSVEGVKHTRRLRHRYRTKRLGVFCIALEHFGGVVVCHRLASAITVEVVQLAE